MIYYMYRVKRLLRNKTLFFWTILFPLGLATLFKFAFSAITEKTWGFDTIPVAVTMKDGVALGTVCGVPDGNGKRRRSIFFGDGNR